MKKRGFALLLTAAMLLALAGCGSSKYANASSTDAAASENGYAYDDAGVDMIGEADWDEDGLGLTENVAESAAYDRAEVKLIKTADLYVEATDFDSAAQTIDALVQEMGGYFENSSVYAATYSGATRSADYTVRVPAEQFEAFLDALAGSDQCSVTRISKSAEDVGMEYFDTESRLTTQQTKLQRLQELLAEATDMEDIIAIESAISEVEYYIDAYTSDLNRYDSLVGYSTITITLDEVVRISENNGEAQSLGSRLGAAFRTGIANFQDGCVDVLLAMAEHFVAVILCALIAAAAIVAVVTALRRDHKRRAEVKAACPEKVSAVQTDVPEAPSGDTEQ